MKSTLWLAQGTNYPQMAMDILNASRLADHIPSRQARIGIKPNLVNETPASHGATTHPEIAEAVIQYLQDHGFADLRILEGSWVGAQTRRAFQVCGYEALSKRYNVPLFDTKKDKGIPVDCGGLTIQVCESVSRLDFLINLPVIKGHCQTRMTCAIKNLKGLIPDAEKRRFHTMGLMKPIGHLPLAMPPSFVLADGICGDLDFEEGGSPMQRDLLIGGYDPVLLDAYVTEDIGMQPESIDYLPIAAKLGVGSMDLQSARVVTLGGGGIATAQHPIDAFAGLESYVRPLDACSACYSNLLSALRQMRDRGSLHTLSSPVCVGQGYRGKRAPLGVGKCCGCCDSFAPGCPPTSDSILAFLEGPGESK